MVLKHPDRPELKGIDKDLFDRHKDYILGEYVYGLRSSEDSGSHAPPWTLVLSYEHAVRKWACKQMAQRSLSFADSLRESWKEPAVKERHFKTPLALYAKRPPPPPANPWKGGKGGGKDGKKGGGKAPGKTGKLKGANRTPDGKPIDMFSVPIERWMSQGGQVPLCPCVLPLLWQPRRACAQDGTGRRQKRGCGSRYARCSLTPSRRCHRQHLPGSLSLLGQATEGRHETGDSKTRKSERQKRHRGVCGCTHRQQDRPLPCDNSTEVLRRHQIESLPGHPA